MHIRTNTKGEQKIEINKQEARQLIAAAATVTTLQKFVPAPEGPLDVAAYLTSLANAYGGEKG